MGMWLEEPLASRWGNDGNGVEQGLQSHMTTGARQVTLTGELGQVKGHEDGVTVMKVGDCLLLSCCPFSANRKHGPRAARSSDFQDKVEKLMFAWSFPSKTLRGPHTVLVRTRYGSWVTSCGPWCSVKCLNVEGQEIVSFSDLVNNWLCYLEKSHCLARTQFPCVSDKVF